MKFDHIAIETQDIKNTMSWYIDFLDNPVILYQDETWGLIETGKLKIAFVKNAFHPPHIGLKVSNKSQEKALADLYPDLKWNIHRDGSKSIYVKDPSGNVVEFVKYEKN